MQWGLRLVKEDKLLRIEHHHLSHDLRSDRSSRTRHQHSLSFDMGCHLLHVDLDRRSLKKVLDAVFAYLRMVQSLVIPFLYRRHGHDLDTQRKHPVEEIRILHLLMLCRRNDHSLDILLVDDIHQLVIILVYRKSHDRLARKVRLVRNEADHLIFAHRV